MSKITLEQFKKFAVDNDIMWYYNKPMWQTGNSGRCYTKEQLAEIRKNYQEDELDALPYIGYNTEGIEIGGGRKFQFGRLWKKVDVDEKIDLTVTMEKPITKKLLHKLHKKCKEIAVPKTPDGKHYILTGRAGLEDNWLYKKFVNNQNREEQMKINLEIARLCHEANREYCISIGDNSQPAWEDAPDNIKESAVDGVQKLIPLLKAGKKVKPSFMHDNWLEFKKADGWKYGKDKNVKLKLHPCMVPFEKLPKEQQAKDEIFIKTVKAEMKNG